MKTLLVIAICLFSITRSFAASSGIAFGDGTTQTTALTSLMASNSTLAAATVFNVKYYGAKGDAIKLSDGVTTSTNLITSATANFTSSDVGKVLWAVNASGFKVMPQTVITAVVSATSILVSSNSVAAQSGLYVIYGTDDSDAIRAVVSNAQASTPRASIYIPAGGYIFSKLLFDINDNSTTLGITVRGAGMYATTFYPAPNYDTTTTSSNLGTFYRTINNPAGSVLSDLTVDGSNYPYNWNGYSVVSFSSNGGLMQNVRVVSFNSPQNLISYLAYVGGGAGVTILNCWFEHGNNIGVAAVGATRFVSTYIGNCVSSGVTVASVAGTGNLGPAVRFVACLVDEESSGDSVQVQNSTDVTFIGTKVFSTTLSKYALNVDGSSVVKAFGSEFSEFGSGSGNGSGILIQSGGKVFASGCRVEGFGTGYYLNNAGTFNDLGGNQFTGSLTNTGSILGPSIPSVLFGTNVLSYSGTSLTWNGTAITVP